MVLGLVVHPHVIGDVGRRQELPTDVAGHLLLVANHVRTQAVLGRKAGLAGLKDKYKNTNWDEPLRRELPVAMDARSISMEIPISLPNNCLHDIVR